jgi:glutamyl-tRNA synthetase
MNDQTSKPIVTRFAPSPTGFLHIGGARTALFNWLFAKHTGGKMLLRIEDTDRQRSTDEAIAAILDGMRWLGINWEGEEFYQFARADRHKAIALELLDKGLAYKCFATAEELTAIRELARAEKRPPRYDGRWRDRNQADIAEMEAGGAKPVIRLKAPQDGDTIIDDQVQGQVVFPNKDLDDLILLRSDGTPTYMLAVVVDDHDMGVTHIIRGDDHLTNAARQSHIYSAMGWEQPVMAHIPLIHGQDGAKLSKRHGALGVEAYRAMGYLPAALRNYLVRLGWSHGDQEFFSNEELVEVFELGQVGRAPSRFDFAKLENMNGHYMRATSDAELLQALLDTLPYLENGAELAARLDDAGRARLQAAIPGLKERSKTLQELLDGAAFLFMQRPLTMTDKAAHALTTGGSDHLRALLPKLEDLRDWNAETTEAAVRAYVEESGAKLGHVAQPLRAALTGQLTSPGIFDVLAVLGKEECLGRLRDQS